MRRFARNPIFLSVAIPSVGSAGDALRKFRSREALRLSPPASHIIWGWICSVSGNVDTARRFDALPLVVFALHALLISRRVVTWRSRVHEHSRLAFSLVEHTSRQPLA